MEIKNKTNNGLLRLPPGFRFHPTDEELVVQYLKRKVLSCPLPASVISDLDVCKSNPWDLPGDTEQERYFFSTKEVKYRNGSRANRATESGYWKATGLDKQILSKRNSALVVGMKKTLVFYRGKPPKGARTDWIMHEYRLAEDDNNNNNNNNNNNRIERENWVLCRIFLKTRNKNMMIKDNSSNNNTKSDGGRGPVLYDFLGKKEGPTRGAENCSSSDASSGITTTTEDDSASANSFTANFSNVFK